MIAIGIVVLLLSTSSDASDLLEAYSCPGLEDIKVDGECVSVTKERLKEFTERNHKPLPYTDEDTDTWNALKELDELESDKTKVQLIYGGTDCKGKDDNEHGDECPWNREHVWPQSRSPKSGNPGKAFKSDLHNLWAVNSVDNSRKNNHIVVECPTCDKSKGEYVAVDQYSPPDFSKGYVARAILYAAVRHGMCLVETLSDDCDSGPYKFGVKSAVLKWHAEHPVTEFEMRRNNIGENLQGNRNPFIDKPKWVTAVFGPPPPDTVVASPTILPSEPTRPPPPPPSSNAPKAKEYSCPMAGKIRVNGQCVDVTRERVREFTERGHKPLPYTDEDTDTWNALKELDELESDKTKVQLIYGGTDCKGKDDNEHGDECPWNREHVWPQSRSPKSGKPGEAFKSDLHNLWAVNSVDNSRKNNHIVVECPTCDKSKGVYVAVDKYSPPDFSKGYVARAILYAAVRHGMCLVEALSDDCEPPVPYKFGVKSAVLKWHAEHPVTEFEMRRNDLAQKLQGNRNPFIDRQDWVTAIFGSPSPGTTVVSPPATPTPSPTDPTPPPPASPLTGDKLIFSEVVEGTSNNKAVEIFNPTDDMIDLSLYAVAVFTNGKTTSSTIKFSPFATLAPGKVFVLCNTKMKSISLCNKVSNKLNFNGDDAVVLFRGDSPTSPTDEEVVDSFGTIGVDPGTAWAVCDGESAADATHVRKPHVDKGSRSWADTGDAATAGENCEWTALAQDDISGLGTHHAEPKVPRTPLMSKVIEGQGYDKAVEIFNPTREKVDLSDYALGVAINGGSSARMISFPDSRILQPGGTYVVCHKKIADDANCDHFSNKLAFNGNDAVVLFTAPSSAASSGIIDTFGVMGVDPGAEGWAVCNGARGADATHVRKASVVRGSADWAATGDAATAGDACEWTQG